MRIKRNVEHNVSKTKLYWVYLDMLKRCNKPYCRIYKHYGGRGITVCDEWMGIDGYKNFKEWSNLNGYQEGLSIDRINNDGNYEPSNCRWVTSKVQQNNKSVNRYMTYQNETHTLTEWADIFGIKPGTLNSRLRYGWSIEEALTKTVDKQHKMKRNMQRCKQEE